MLILLTGARGLVGKNILEHQASEKYDFLTPTSQELNLLDQLSVTQYLKTHRPDYVIHSAGVVGGIQANIAEPVRFLVDNMRIGLNILMAAKDAGVKHFLNLGSSCMYPRDAANPLAEEAVLKGELEPTNEGYALAKVAAARLCDYIHHEDSAYLYKTVIPCNLYGRHDKFDPAHSHMIPAVIRKLAEAVKADSPSIDIWGDGTARREFMYAGDLADFIFYTLEHFEKMPQYLNVGLGHDYTINEYYQIIADVVGYKGEFTHDLTKPAGMKQKLVDNTRLADFGWQAQTSLKDGIHATYQYYLNEYHHE